MIRQLMRSLMSEETHAARVELREARRDLARVSAQSPEETPAYRVANRRVIRAETRLAWWQRLDIELLA